jgi:hypothetical protein
LITLGNPLGRFDLGDKIDWIAVGVETAKKLHRVATVTAKVIVCPIERPGLALALVTQHAQRHPYILHLKSPFRSMVFLMCEAAAMLIPPGQ